MVFGVRVYGDSVVNTEVVLNDLFCPVPIAAALGIPIVYKKMSGTGGDDSHIKSNAIVRFMVDPDDGLAPGEWQYGGAMGPAPPVVLARRDKVPFSVHDWDTMFSYISEWSDEACEAEDDRQSVNRRYITPAAFKQFVHDNKDEHPLGFLSLRFPLHSTVIAQGLSMDELNHVDGEVLQYSRDRVGIKFPDREIVALKSERLTLVRERPEATPEEENPDVVKRRRDQRKAHLSKMEALQISERFVECLHEDTFPEMGDLHLFGVGCDYKARAQDVLAVWQGAVKHQDLKAQTIADALENGRVKEFLMETCYKLSKSLTPNSTYANALIQNRFAALEWDDL